MVDASNITDDACRCGAWCSIRVSSMELDGETITARCNGFREHHPGDTVKLDVTGARLHAFTADGLHRLDTQPG